MTSVFYGLRRGGELLVAPFDLLAPVWALVLIALITAVLMVLVVGKVTPQKKIAVARSKMASAIYEIRLFLDSPKRVFASQGRLLWSGFVYTWYLMPAFLVLSLPLALLYVHLEPRYGLTGLEPGSQSVLVIDLADGADGYAVGVGDMPSGLAVTAPTVVDEEAGTVYMRLDANTSGVYELPITIGEHTVTKSIAVGEQDQVAPIRTSGADILWNIGLEQPIESGAPIESIEVVYPAADQEWFGLGMPWWLFWLLAATIAALVVKRPLGVEL